MQLRADPGGSQQAALRPRPTQSATTSDSCHRCVTESLENGPKIVKIWKVWKPGGFACDDLSCFSTGVYGVFFWSGGRTSGAEGYRFESCRGYS
jgi:hypothetical protein